MRDAERMPRNAQGAESPIGTARPTMFPSN
jgi:hypothetical protein